MTEGGEARRSVDRRAEVRRESSLWPKHRRRNNKERGTDRGENTEKRRKKTM